MRRPRYQHRHTYPLTKEKGRQKPRLPVRLVNFETGESVLTNALIDTGSDSCVFPKYLSDAVGHKCTEDSKRVEGLKGISGIEVESFVHPFKIELLAPDLKTPVIVIDAVAFTVNTKNLTPILGTHRFLEFFKVSVDYKKGNITVEW